MTGKQNDRGPRRLDAYIRVSDVAGREGDSFISPKVQEERIRAWAVANGHEIIAVHHELDVSGGTMDRPLLNLVMARIESGETDGVVVFKLDRFARTVVGAVDLIERISERRALFASVSDGFDITTDTGMLVLNVLLSIAKFERDRIKTSWRTARNEAVGRGIHLASWVPFGYRRRQDSPVNPRTGKPLPAPLEVDPVTGPYVGEIFRRRAAAVPLEQLRDWLVEETVPTVKGGPWAVTTVKNILRNRVYLGIARGGHAGDHPDGVANAHPPLIDEATWHAAQLWQTGLSMTRKPAPTLLRGLVRCGSCRYTMVTNAPKRTGGRNGQGHRAYRYQCAGDHQCSRPAGIVAIKADGTSWLDDAVVELMWEHLGRIEFQGFDETLDVTPIQDELAELVLRRERDAEDAELEAALGRAAWKKKLATLTVQINGVQERLEETLRQMGRPQGRPLAELRADWESGEMSMDEMRRHIAGAIQAVFVKPGRTTFGPVTPSVESRRAKLSERVDIVWTTDPELVDEIPRKGKKDFVVRPWAFPDANPDVAGPVLLEPPVVDAGDTVG